MMSGRPCGQGERAFQVEEAGRAKALGQDHYTLNTLGYEQGGGQGEACLG